MAHAVIGNPYSSTMDTLCGPRSDGGLEDIIYWALATPAVPIIARDKWNRRISIAFSYIILPVQ
jgi:hypothetical protein